MKRTSRILAAALVGLQLFTGVAQAAPTYQMRKPVQGLRGSYQLSASPPSLSFADTLVGQSTAAQQVTFTNSGGTSLSITTLGGAAGFNATDNDCNGVLAPNASCTARVTCGRSTRHSRSSSSRSRRTPSGVANFEPGGSDFR